MLESLSALTRHSLNSVLEQWRDSVGRGRTCSENRNDPFPQLDGGTILRLDIVEQRNIVGCTLDDGKVYRGLHRYDLGTHPRLIQTVNESLLLRSPTLTGRSGKSQFPFTLIDESYVRPVNAGEAFDAIGESPIEFLSRRCKFHAVCNRTLPKLAFEVFPRVWHAVAIARRVPRGLHFKSTS